MDIKSYLNRIHYHGLPEPSLAVLGELQRSHLLSIPFENLDIHSKIPIDFTNSFEKIVTNNRGGFCYELNYLFYELLQAIGFQCRLISARVYDKERGFGPEFDHMAIVVSLNDAEYLSDVGFGEFAFHPLQLVLNEDMHDDRGIYRMERFDDSYWALKKYEANNEWCVDYIFTLKERHSIDFMEMCYYHQTAGESPFAKNILCNLLTPTGRITLSGDRLKVIDGASVTEEVVLAENREAILKKWFFRGRV